MANGICKMEKVIIKCPLGNLVLYGCDKGIHELNLQKDAVPESSVQGAPVLFEVCESSQEMSAPMKQCTSWLHTYFCEPWLIEKVPTPAFHHPVLEKDSFTKTVLYSLMKTVKMGDTVSYKQLAEIAGNEKAARAVGGAMRSNPIPLLIPCHRVICSSGKPGNYGSGKANHLKEWLLAHEKLLKEM